MMLNTILFDLDGTVLPMDLDRFVKSYFGGLALHLKELIEPAKLTKIMMECTNLMITNTEAISNQDVFMERFEQLVDADRDLFLSKFTEYYDTTFQDVKKTTWQNNDIIESVKILKEKGYTVALATNPLFPMKANHHRIKWAGLLPSDFSYISSYENNNYCKPNVQYYEEVLSKIGKTPKECMMIGNDMFEDTIASKIGIQTYIITNNMVNRHNAMIEPDDKGTYKEFLEFVKLLPNIK